MPQYTNKCIVKGCNNLRHEGHFEGDLCGPCHSMLTNGYVGPSEAWFIREINSLRRAVRKRKGDTYEDSH